MKRKVTNHDVGMLASIAQSLRADYVSNDAAWEGSPFAWIRTRPSRQKGKIGEQLVAGWCAAKSLNVERSPDSDADRVIEGKRVEIKLSTLWESGIYKFQQLRDQNYEYLICLGISPFDARAWVFKKSEIPFDRLDHQHGGSRGRDTWWIEADPNRPPRWMMRDQRGKLSDVYRILKSR